MVSQRSSKLDVVSYATTHAEVMACVGLLLGVVYSIGGLFTDLFTIGLNFGTLLAFCALVVMPLIAAAFGFVTALVGAVLYNLGKRML